MDSIAAQSQRNPAKEKWLNQTIDTIYDDFQLSSEDRIWVEDILLASCKCNQLTDRVAMDECGKKMLVDAGFSEDFNPETMTLEQQNKLILLTPLMSVAGTCPE